MALSVLLWEAKLAAMNRCEKNLFQITSIWRFSVAWLFQLGQNRLAKHSIAFKLAVITKVRQSLKHLVLQREFPWCFFSGVVRKKCSGRLFSCSTICVTSKHAIKKAIIRFGKNSLLSTSFMRPNCNKGHCEVLSEGALIGCPLLTGVSSQFWAWMRDNYN